jgi:hypothetical protein
MTAQLNFNLDDIDDRMAFERYNKANDMAFALFEILRNTKKRVQYHVEFNNLDSQDTIEYVYETIWEIVLENHINIDAIV